MFITCKNCDTTFQLDEQLLKPGGSKVRCSQCRNVFVAHPPEPEEPVHTVDEALPPEEEMSLSPEEAAEASQADDGADGIDLAELDALLDPDTSPQDGSVESSAMAEENDAADLGLDDGLATLLDEDQETGVDTEDLLAGIDLDMDFELDDSGAEGDLIRDTQADQAVEEPADSLDVGGDDLDLGDLHLALDEPPRAATDGGGDDFEELSLDLESSLAESDAAAAAGTDSSEQQAADDFEELTLDLEGAEDAMGLDDLNALIQPSDDGIEELILDDEYEEISLEVDDSEVDTFDLEALTDDGGLAGEATLMSGAMDDAFEEIVLEPDAPSTGPEELSLEESDVDDLRLEMAEAASDESVGDLDLDMDVDAPAADESRPAAPESDELDLDLDDLGLEEPQTSAAALSESPADSAAKAEDIDFDLDLDMDEQTALEEPDIQESDLSLDDGILDEKPAETVLASADDLDLDDLDDMLSIDDAEEAPSLAAEPEEASLSASDRQDDMAEIDFSDLDNLDLADGELELEDQEASEDLSLDLASEEISLEGDILDGPPDAGPAKVSDDLDLSGLGDILDETDTNAPAAANLELEDAELSLDDDLPGDAVDVSDDASELISLDDGGLEEAPEVELSSDADDLELGDLDDILSGVDASDDSDLDIASEDMDLSLDIEEEPVGAEAGDATELISLDDDDLSLEMEDESPSAQTEDQAEVISLDDDLGELDDLTMDTTPEAEPSDLDDIFGAEEKTAADGDLTLLAEDIDLSDFDSEAAAQSDDQLQEDEDLEDLDFELDAEFEDKPTAKAATDQQAEPQEDDSEIDLSDIEDLLESGDLAAGATPQSTLAEELDGDLMGGDDEFDLTELESAIDEAGTEADDTAVEEDLDFDLDLGDDEGADSQPDIAGEATLLDGDLDLDLDDEDQAAVESIDDLDLELEMEGDAPSGTGPADDASLLDESELDLSDLHELVDDSESAKRSDVIDAGDIELEFEIEEPSEEPMPLSVTSEPITASGARTADAVTELAMDETITAPLDEEEKPVKPLRPRPVVKTKKSSSKSLVVVLILILLGGGGYLGYDYVIKNDIQIPYLSEYINPRPKDPAGVLNLSTMEITSKFIENEQGGRLFVITGKVRNGYPETRSMVSLRGKLFAKGKVMVKTEKTFAGISIPDQELRERPVQDIKNQLKSTPKPEDIGTLMRPGQVLPFMIVFSDLPDDLDEFAIEAVGSTPVQ